MKCCRCDSLSIGRFPKTLDIYILYMKHQPQILWCRVIDEGLCTRMDLNSVQPSYSAYPYFFFSVLQKQGVCDARSLSELSNCASDPMSEKSMALTTGLPVGPSANILPYSPDLGRVRYNTHRNGFASSGPCGFTRLQAVNVQERVSLPN